MPMLPHWVSSIDGWMVSTLAIGGILGFRAISAPYWIWKEERTARVAADIQVRALTSRQSDIQVSLNDKYAFGAGNIDIHGKALPPAKMFTVHMLNRGEKFLQQCQLTFGNQGQTGTFVSAPFDLRRGEQKDMPVLHIINSSEGAHAIVAGYAQRDGKWGIVPGGWLPKPGTYEVQALSADTEPATLSVTLRDNPEWALTPRSANLEAFEPLYPCPETRGCGFESHHAHTPLVNQIERPLASDHNT